MEAVTWQWPVLQYVHDESGFGAGSLVRAVTDACHTRPDLGAEPEDRRRQRRPIAGGHDLVYSSVPAHR